MLEWLTSKVVISVAALVILASVGGFFAIQREAWQEEELVQISKDLADVINDMSLLGSESTITVGFDAGGNGLNLKNNVNGQSYKIELYRDMVRCSLNEKFGISNLFNNVHLFAPLSIDLSNLTELRSMDMDHQKIDSDSIGQIIIMRRFVGDPGTGTFDTFVFMEG